MAHTMGITAIAQTICVPLQLAAAAIHGSFRNAPLAVFTHAALGGAVINPVSIILWRMSNLRTANLEINVLLYAGPMLAIIWLHIAGRTNVPQPDLLIIGALSTAAANYLLTIRHRLPATPVTVLYAATLATYISR